MSPDQDYKTKEKAEALNRLRNNPRIAEIRVAAPQECSVGQSIQGVYQKDDVPTLPVKGCSRPGGCICTYEPVIEELYP